MSVKKPFGDFEIWISINFISSKVGAETNLIFNLFEGYLCVYS
jgi:hypothetical protein